MRACRRGALLIAAVLVGGAFVAVPASSARAQTGARAQAGAPSAPSRAPLVSAGAGGSEAGEAEGGSPQGEVDPLVSNGLGSPSCARVIAAGLSSTDRRHCESSGFVASAAPTPDYGIDVHIDTGVLGVGSMLSSAIQDVVVAPIWMGLVWAVHALVVMLEWCFTIDLLPSAAAGSLGRGLRQMESALTAPWLPVSLAIASVLALYHGLIRRRVAATMGEVLLMAAMMVGGLWVISDPTGTVGALGAWANQVALGTLAAAAQGAPSHAEATFADSLDTIFASAIDGPWCYLEFGSVEWCRDPSRLEPKLRNAGLRIAAAELAQVGCAPGSVSTGRCIAAGSGPARTLARSAQLLHEAQSNGAIFLALPPNGPERNSINESSSLLRTMCQSSEATNCDGPDAAQAQFRTGAQTPARLGGLLLIAAGMLGMLLLLGFIVLRLLAASLFSLLYLLCAPAMVLAPAFGEGGRAVFRKWGLQLLGTVVSKLLFSFLLGAVLAVIGVIASLTALGWWTQWLLMSALWWGAYARRHQALGVAAGAIGREHVERSSIGRRMGSTLGARGRDAVERWNERRRERKRRPPEVEWPPSRPRPDSGGGSSGGGTPPETGPTSDGPSSGPVADPSEAEQHPESHIQLGRVHRERERAEAAGDKRRAAELQARGRRIEAEIEQGQERTAALREPAEGRLPVDEGRPRSGPGHPMRTPQAAGPAPVRAAHERHSALKETRDYAALAVLAGYTRTQYEQLDPSKRREARLAIDRGLAARRDQTARPVGADARAPAGATRPASDADASQASQPPPELPRRGRAPESSVMRDAREVEAGRKRQLGPGRA